VRLNLSLVMLALGAGLLGAAIAQGSSETVTPIRDGGTFRIAVMGSTGDIDPAIVHESAVGFLLEPTCARLMTYPDKPPPEGFRLVPEVATRYPRVSKDGKTFTFTLRRGFRFSNGDPVRASAFAHAITRTLEMKGYGAQLVQEIVGADRVQNGTARRVRGIAARGNQLVIRLTRAAPDFPARMAALWFCAVPPTLPADPEGVLTFPAAGPYYVAENVHGRRIVLRRNRFYRGSRPHHVTSFVAEVKGGSFDDVLDSIEQGAADWGWAPRDLYLQPARRLVAKYGINRSQFFLEPGLVFRHYHLNTSRPLFRNNPRLRRAVNFAVDRSAVQRALEGRLGSRLTDQYLPPGFPGFRDARIYPLEHPNVAKARALARGHRRSGKAVLYAFDIPLFIAAAQGIKANLAKIGIDVEIKSFPFDVLFQKLFTPGEPWDIAWGDWTPDFLDPFTYINSLLDGQFVSTNNLSHFNVEKYNLLMRKTARLQGAARYRAYGALDVRLAREAAPMVAISYLKEFALVSKRVDRRCIVLRPELDLTAVCLK